jgi:hypothetical protein
MTSDRRHQNRGFEDKLGRSTGLPGRSRHYGVGHLRAEIAL